MLRNIALSISADVKSAPVTFAPLKSQYAKFANKNFNIQDRLKTLIPYTEDKKNFVFDIHLKGKKETIFFEF